MATLDGPGRIGTLNQEQENTLKNFRAEIERSKFYDPQRHDDHTLLRFLRARKFDPVKSLKMFNDCEEWREKENVNTILNDFEFPERNQVQKIYPRFYHKTDKLGRPLYFEQLGTLDVNEIFKITSQDRIIRNHIYEYERLLKLRFPACSNQSNCHIDQSVTILDLKGVSLFQFANVFNFVKQVADIAQNYYPELLGRMFIINAPWLFSSVWNMVKPLLDEVTVKKIAILGGNYKSEVFQEIAPENFPSELGGSCTCPEGCSNSDAGPWNDPEFKVTLDK